MNLSVKKIFGGYNKRKQEPKNKHPLVFGGLLEELIKWEQSHLTNPSNVPFIVQDFCTQIYQHKKKGIFRQPGRKTHIDELIIRYNTEASSRIDISEERSYKLLGSVIKKYFRDLQCSLITPTQALYDRWVEAANAEKDIERHNLTMSVLNDLSDIHYDTLEYFVQQCILPIMNDTSLCMDIDNLSKILGPTLAFEPKPPGGTPTNTKTSLTEMMIIKTTMVKQLHYFLTHLNTFLNMEEEKEDPIEDEQVIQEDAAEHTIQEDAAEHVTQEDPAEQVTQEDAAAEKVVEEGVVGEGVVGENDDDDEEEEEEEKVVLMEDEDIVKVDVPEKESDDPPVVVQQDDVKPQEEEEEEEEGVEEEEIPSSPQPKIPDEKPIPSDKPTNGSQPAEPNQLLDEPTPQGEESVHSISEDPVLSELYQDMISAHYVPDSPQDKVKEQEDDVGNTAFTSIDQLKAVVDKEDGARLLSQKPSAQPSSNPVVDDDLRHSLLDRDDIRAIVADQIQNDLAVDNLTRKIESAIVKALKNYQQHMAEDIGDIRDTIAEVKADADTEIHGLAHSVDRVVHGTSDDTHAERMGSTRELLHIQSDLSEMKEKFEFYTNAIHHQQDVHDSLSKQIHDFEVQTHETRRVIDREISTTRDSISRIREELRSMKNDVQLYASRFDGRLKMLDHYYRENDRPSTLSTNHASTLKVSTPQKTSKNEVSEQKLSVLRAEIDSIYSGLKQMSYHQ